MLFSRPEIFKIENKNPLQFNLKGVSFKKYK